MSIRSKQKFALCKGGVVAQFHLHDAPPMLTLLFFVTATLSHAAVGPGAGRPGAPCSGGGVSKCPLGSHSLCYCTLKALLFFSLGLFMAWCTLTSLQMTQSAAQNCPVKTVPDVVGDNRVWRRMAAGLIPKHRSTTMVFRRFSKQLIVCTCLVWVEIYVCHNHFINQNVRTILVAMNKTQEFINRLPFWIQYSSMERLTPKTPKLLNDHPYAMRREDGSPKKTPSPSYTLLSHIARMPSPWKHC
jgi:hypothetical protein